ncbi:MAG: alpha/beta fold hydrolase [Bacteroidota bacterium]|jgi:pimeloyl-ACP methyl ester carboxylesterase
MNLSFKKYGQGTPLLIFHGLFGSGDNWTTHAKKWAEHGFCVYTIDQRNHGHSAHSNEMNYQLMADDAENLIASEGLRDIILLGHSMGGKTSLYLAERIPFIISKMVIVDMGTKAYPPHHNEVFKALRKIPLDQIKTRGEAEVYMKESSLDQATQQFLLKNLFWIEPGKLAWRFNLDVLENTIPNIIAGFNGTISSIPTLFIRGGHSNYILKDDINQISKQINLAQFKTLTNSGHWPHAEQPNEFFNAVLQFIS